MRVIVIPARLGSSRLPRKALLPAPDGRPLIQHVWDRASDSRKADLITVVTDSAEIADAVNSFGGSVCFLDSPAKTGTDRVSDWVESSGLAVERVVNLQGDELGVDGESLDLLLGSDHDLLTLACPLADGEDADPNSVKVLVDHGGYAVHFSRTPLPRTSGVYKHLGAYAFSPDLLRDFHALPQGDWEASEGLEQLRLTQHGFRWRVYRTGRAGPSLNTGEDYIRWHAQVRHPNHAAPP